MADFHINTETAWRLVKELGYQPNLFTGFPDRQGHTIYGVNYRLRTIYRMTRQEQLVPSLRLTYDQVCQMHITPVEAHPVLLASFESPSDS